jgi:hypothetical protein
MKYTSTMKITIDEVDDIEIHFVLCTERTGSSLFSLLLNLNDEILSPSEETFALYFYRTYAKKENWSKEDLIKFADEFWLMADKNLDLYFSKKEQFIRNLTAYREDLTFERLVKLCYLHFLPPKDKTNVRVIVDKQIKYFFHLPQIRKIFPSAKFIVLTRDVRDNVISKQNRKLNWHTHPFYLAALWNQTYSNVKHLADCGFLTVRYEDLVTDTSIQLQKVCAYFDVNFQPKMTDNTGVYDRFIAESKEGVAPEFIEKLVDFHSGLFQKPDISKIGQYKTKLDPKTLSGIEAMNSGLFEQFGYTNEINQPKLPRLTGIFFHLLAYLYRDGLLNFYLRIPFSVKLWIKKIKGKQIGT